MLRIADINGSVVGALLQKLSNGVEGCLLLARGPLVAFEHDEVTLGHWLLHVDSEVTAKQLLVDQVATEWSLSERVNRL